MTAPRNALTLRAAALAAALLVLSGCVSAGPRPSEGDPVVVAPAAHLVLTSPTPPAPSPSTSMPAPPTPAPVAHRPGTPGAVFAPIGRTHLEVFEWFNVLQVVDASNTVIRTIKISGNPTIPKPDVCTTQGGIAVNWDYSLQWRLPFFTRLCDGRGLGTHDIPTQRDSGAPSMLVSQLGKPPALGGPLSHGCLRMATADARYIYENYSQGVPVYFVKTPYSAATG